MKETNWDAAKSTTGKLQEVQRKSVFISEM